MRILLFILFNISAFSQKPTILFFSQTNVTIGVPSFPTGTDYRGVYGFGQNPNNFESEWKGYHLTIEWANIETSSGVYNWTSTDNDINSIINAGLYCTVQFQFGPQCPIWLRNSAGSFTTHGGNDPGPYPRYYNPVYKTAYYAFLKKIAQHLVLFPEIFAWQVAEGSTGDEGPYKGTLDAQFVGDNPDYIPNGPDTKWGNFRKDAWDSANKYISQTGNPNLNMLINSGNNGENVEYVNNRFPNALIKEGRTSHAYMFDGQSMYTTRPEIFSRGEVQGTIFNTTHPEKDAYALVVSAVSLGLGILNTAPGWYTQIVGNDKRPDKFFNKYSNDTIAYTSTRAFINLAQPIGLDNIVQWPVNPYGAVIQTGQVTAYNNAINNINNSNDGESYKAYQRIQVINKLDAQNNWVYFNPARETAIRAANASNGATWNYIEDANNVNNYGNDYIFGNVVNYSKWITETNPYANTIPLYKVAPDTSIYGRFAGQFNIIGGVAEMPFDIDDNWSSNATSGNIQFEITYKNSGTGQWSLYANTGSGMQSIVTYTNTNTNQFAKKVITVNNMQLGSATDFKLHYNSGANTIFCTIELVNILP